MEKALAQAEALKLQVRLEDLTVWQMEKVKQTRKGSKTYTYCMASWREGGKRATWRRGKGPEDEGGGARIVMRSE